MDIKLRLEQYLKLPGEDPIGDPLAREALAEIERLEHCIGTWLIAEEEWKRELAEAKALLREAVKLAAERA
jgi:hypothetical protein